MFTRDLSANVPLYGQEFCTWCGAATGQMIRNGYPNPADRLFYAQLDVWNTIQAKNSTDPADTAWATDPHGLTGGLQSLANPAGVHWSEFADANRDTVMFDMLYWMNQRQYPSGVLINQGGHWVVVAGFVTDVEPLHGTNPVLQSITIHDPEPHNVGTISTFTGAQWYGGPWNGAIIYAGSWLNKYVAVVEPPLEGGLIRVKTVKRTGEKIIPASQAVEYATRWIKELGLGRQASYALLEHKDATPLEPLVVREETGRKGIRNVPQYYIVPFGLRNEHAEGSRLARVCVLINAFTGAFEEVTAFGKPLRFLAKAQALAIVAAALRVQPEKLGTVEAALMFQPSDITHVRTFPFWQVKVGKRILYVDQLGKLYGKLLPSIPGD